MFPTNLAALLKGRTSVATLDFLILSYLYLIYYNIGIDKGVCLLASAQISQLSEPPCPMSDNKPFPQLSQHLSRIPKNSIRGEQCSLSTLSLEGRTLRDK